MNGEPPEKRETRKQDRVRRRIEICKRTGAKSLDLSSQGLDSIPDNLWEVTKLESLSLSRNNLHVSIPSEVSRLYLLRELDLSMNHLTSIGEELKDLLFLATLKLNNNDIHGGVGSLSSLPRLQALHLSNNPWISDLRIESNSLTELRAVCTGHFPLHNLGVGLPNLRHLYLSFNNYAKLPSSFFASLTSLRVLSLSENRFTRIKDLNPNNTLSLLRHLETLDLANNELTKVPYKSNGLAGLTALKQLCLKGNPLRHISYTFSFLPQFNINHNATSTTLPYFIIPHYNNLSVTLSFWGYPTTPHSTLRYTQPQTLLYIALTTVVRSRDLRTLLNTQQRPQPTTPSQHEDPTRILPQELQERIVNGWRVCAGCRLLFYGVPRAKGTILHQGSPFATQFCTFTCISHE